MVAARSAGEAAPVAAPPLLTRSGRPARVALVHDWFASYYGSERVVAEMLRCFPQAELFALADVLPQGARGFLGDRPVTTSFIQRLPFARRHFRLYLPLMPLAIEQLDMGPFDLVLSSSHAFAKGVLTGPRQLHVGYVHAPIRYAWEYQHQYLAESRLGRGPLGYLTRRQLHRLRIWDQRTGPGVDRFLANSRFIADRIHKIYRREATVVYPPVEVERFTPSPEKDDHYLAVSRFVPYKRTELVIEAFRSMPDRRLVVVGEGPGFRRAKAEAPANVTLLGFQPALRLRELMARARALVFAAEEDFGITLVEAQAAGTAVVAYRAGGALESIRGLEDRSPTGVLFDEQDTTSIIDAIHRLERHADAISPEACRANALRFRPEAFRQAFLREVTSAWAEHLARS